MLRAPVIATVAGALALVADPTFASPLRVDFGHQGQPTESGWQTFSVGTSGPDASDDDLSASQAFTSDFGAVTVTLQNVDFRTFETVTSLGPGVGDLENVLVDTIRENGNPAIRVTLSGLEAGLYSWLGYHHLAHPTAERGPIDIELSVDGGVSRVLVVNNLEQSEGVTDVVPAASSFSFVANGTDAVVLSFYDGNRESNPNVLLNGFELDVVPEPASLALLGLGGLLMCYRRA